MSTTSRYTFSRKCFLQTSTILTNTNIMDMIVVDLSFSSHCFKKEANKMSFFNICYLHVYISYTASDLYTTHNMLMS